MPIIVVARLRLRDHSLQDEFFGRATAVLEQAQQTDGNLGADAFADAHDVWWDVTAWQGRAPIETFMNTEPHLSTRALVNHLCDEASFVDWKQDSPQLPDWQTAWRRLVADGESAPITNASDANKGRDFPAPVVPPSSVA
jgi:hypothetical protein